MFVNVKTEVSVEVPDYLSANDALETAEDVVQDALAGDARVKIVYVTRQDVLYEATPA